MTPENDQGRRVGNGGRDPCRQLTGHPRPDGRPPAPTTRHDRATCAVSCCGRSHGRVHHDHHHPPTVTVRWCGRLRNRGCATVTAADCADVCAMSGGPCAVGMRAALRTAGCATHREAAQSAESAQPPSHGQLLRGRLIHCGLVLSPGPQWAPPGVQRARPSWGRGWSHGRADHETNQGFVSCS